MTTPEGVLPDVEVPMQRREAVQRLALLLGASAGAPALVSALARSAAAAATSSSFTPRALSPEQLEQVATIAEHIIPATDTPGARAAGVHRFIDTMLAEYYSPAAREHLLNGLGGVDARARRSFGRALLACTAANQRALLEQLDRETFRRPAADSAVANAASRETERGGGGLAAAGDEARRTPNAGAGSLPECFRAMKELTLLGYYTSQVGATKELRYLQVPGRFDGCVPFTTIGRAWAT